MAGGWDIDEFAGIQRGRRREQGNRTGGPRPQLPEWLYMGNGNVSLSG